MPATKRRREDKKPSATTSFGMGRAVNVPTAPKVRGIRYGEVLAGEASRDASGANSISIGLYRN